MSAAPYELGQPSSTVPPPEDVTFLRRAPPGPADLWIEAIDWAPTVFTGAGMTVLPYLIWRLASPDRPELLSARLLPWLFRDRVVYWVFGLAALVCVALFASKVVQLRLERRGRIVRLDLSELECWPGRSLRYIPVRDVVGAQPGRVETTSRWWIFRPPRPALTLFVKRADGTIERVLVDWSRHDAVGEMHGLAPDADGNRIAAELIARARARRVEHGFPIEELPDVAIDVSGEHGLKLCGDRDQVVLTLPGRTITLPGWALRSAAVVTTPARSGGTQLALALELDPRCGEFHLLVNLGRSQGDREIVEWCQLLAARFDKDPAAALTRFRP